MAKKNDNNYTEQQKELNRQIAEEKFSHIYMICGPQDYLRSQNAGKLRKAILGSGDAMNSSVFTGNDFTIPEVIDLAETMPFFADRRVIVLENTWLFGKKSSETEALADYLEKLPETTYLIFVEEDPAGTTRLMKQIRKLGFVLECSTPEETDLKKWVVVQLRTRGQQISGRGLDALISSAGDDMLNIQNELNKLSDYCYGRELITDEDVRAVCSVRVKDRIFDMISAIANHDTDQALRIYADLTLLKTPPQVILSLMTRQFNQLLQAGELLQSHSESETASMLKINPYVLSKRIRPTLRGYSRASLVQALQDCVQVNMDYRSGKIDPKVAVEKLIVTYSSRPSTAK